MQSVTDVLLPTQFWKAVSRSCSAEARIPVGYHVKDPDGSGLRTEINEHRQCYDEATCKLLDPFLVHRREKLISSSTEISKSTRKFHEKYVA